MYYCTALSTVFDWICALQVFIIIITVNKECRHNPFTLPDSGVAPIQDVDASLCIAVDAVVADLTTTTAKHHHARSLSMVDTVVLQQKVVVTLPSRKTTEFALWTVQVVLGRRGPRGS